MRHLLLAAAFGVVVSASQQPSSPFLGRWNMTGTGPHSHYVYWLEVAQEKDGQLSGTFLNRTSSPVRLAVVKIEGNELVFQMGGRRGTSGPEFRARLDANGRLVGRHSIGDEVVNWIGVRPPAFPPANANGTHRYGTPVVLFDGKSLDAFTVQHVDRPMNWSIEDGLATNLKGANNLVSKQRFKDFRIQAEYRLGPGSNSGIYLRGRYELQLFDDFGQPTRNTGHMAIYGRKPADVNASKPAGEWQTMEAIVVANRVTVTLNGQRVHDNAVIDGITGGALDNDELAPGPIMVQGDHTPMWLRRLVVTPIN